MTTIAAIRSRPIVIPLERETAFSSRSLKHRHYALVEVIGDDGVVGSGFCYVGHDGSQLVADAVRLLLKPRAVGDQGQGRPRRKPSADEARLAAVRTEIGPE